MPKNWKKLFAMSAIFSVLTSISPPLAHAISPFPDVPEDHEFVDSISWMKENLIFTGNPDGTFTPERVLNRAEQLKVTMLLHGINPSVEEYNNCFNDVSTEWYAPYICFAKEQGWVKGFDDGSFQPSKEVNKAEAIKMLGEVQDWSMRIPSSDPYLDVIVGQWYAKYVNYAKDAGLLLEENTTMFYPAAGIYRDSTAEVLFRSLAIYALDEPGYDPILRPQLLTINIEDLEPIIPITPTLTPTAEFGDAPEQGPAGYTAPYDNVQAAFPTLYNTSNSSFGNGAHALDSSEEWLGDPSLNNSYSYEKDANDSNDPDGVMNLTDQDDFDDGVRGLNISLVNIPPPATLTVDVTVADNAPSTTRYLNVLIDLNMDGKWEGAAAGGEKEWAVQNQAISVAPGTTKTITTDPFAYSNGLLLTPTSWMRVVLSREPIDSSKYGLVGWDGSDQFEYGEVEDYYLQLPNWDNGDGTLGGGPGGPGSGGRGLVWGKPAPVMMCPRKVNFPKDMDVVRFSCGVYNFGGAGDTKFDLWRVTGGVDVFPLTGIVTMPTAPPGFPPFGVVGNPTRVWFTAFRGDIPSTWNYKIVGVDPISQVVDGRVDLGLVEGEKDEGFDGGDAYTIYDLASWVEEVDNAYLIPPDHSEPFILDAVFAENNMGEFDYNFEGIATVRNVEGSGEYVWSSPNDCGVITQNPETPNTVLWQFNEIDYASCMEGGLNLEVFASNGSHSESFADAFMNY